MSIIVASVLEAVFVILDIGIRIILAIKNCRKKKVKSRAKEKLFCTLWVKVESMEHTPNGSGIEEEPKNEMTEKETFSQK